MHGIMHFSASKCKTIAVVHPGEWRIYHFYFQQIQFDNAKAILLLSIRLAGKLWRLVGKDSRLVGSAPGMVGRLVGWLPTY